VRLSSPRTGKETTGESDSGKDGSVQRKADAMLNAAIGFLVIVLLGIFAAGSCELTAERAKRRRVEKWIRERYGKTY
jgi:hypothetical protein